MLQTFNYKKRQKEKLEFYTKTFYPSGFKRGKKQLPDANYIIKTTPQKLEAYLLSIYPDKTAINHPRTQQFIKNRANEILDNIDPSWHQNIDEIIENKQISPIILSSGSTMYEMFRDYINHADLVSIYDAFGIVESYIQNKELIESGIF